MDDPTHPLPSAMQQEKLLGSIEWWRIVIKRWNRSQYSSSLAGLGVVKFSVMDSSINPVLIRWDKTGSAAIVDENVEGAPYFPASAQNWSAFVRGERTAIAAVFEGDIRFVGSLVAILPYAKSFDLLAKVANDATDKAIR